MKPSLIWLKKYNIILETNLPVNLTDRIIDSSDL